MGKFLQDVMSGYILGHLMYWQVFARYYERIHGYSHMLYEHLASSCKILLAGIIDNAICCMGKLLQDDMSGIGKLLQDIMSRYIAIATCCYCKLLQDVMCFGHLLPCRVVARCYEPVYSHWHLLQKQAITRCYGRPYTVASAKCCYCKML